MKSICLYFFLLMLPYSLLAQDGNDTVYIHTSAQCGTCKTKIEHDMAFVKGVKSVVLDVETRQLMVVYNSRRNTIEGLRNALSKIGYDADTVAADPKAYMKLPDCCKKGGHD